MYHIRFSSSDRSRTSSRVSVPKMSLIPGDAVGYENDLNDELDSIQVSFSIVNFRSCIIENLN